MLRNDGVCFSPNDIILSLEGLTLRLEDEGKTFGLHDFDGGSCLLRTLLLLSNCSVDQVTNNFIIL